MEMEGKGKKNLKEGHARMDQTTLVEVIGIVVGRPGVGPLCQVDLYALRCSCKEVNKIVSNLCFNTQFGAESVEKGQCRKDADDVGRWFLDSYGTIQPVNIEIIHPVLYPLVVEGHLNMDRAIYCAERNASEFRICNEPLTEELSRRWTAISALNKLSSENWRVLSTIAGSRSRRKLWLFLSCGSIWAIALGLLRPRRILNYKEPTEALLALLGLNEMEAAMDQHQNPTALRCTTSGGGGGGSGSGGMGSSSWSSSQQHQMIGLEEPTIVATMLNGTRTNLGARNEGSRSLKEQWNICKWLWEECKVKRNQNVRDLLRFCSEKYQTGMVPAFTEKLHMPATLMRLIVEKKFVREALSDKAIILQDLMVMYSMCGIGHVKQILTKHGVQAIRSGYVTIKDLMKLPRYGLVRAIIREPQLVTCDIVQKMRAPIDQRPKMVDFIVSKKSTWIDFCSLEELITLPSFDALEFVLSHAGKCAFEQSLINFNDFSDASQSSSLGLGISFRQENAKVLRVFLGSLIGKAMLGEKIVTIPSIIRNVHNLQVLSALLSPAGKAVLQSGKYSLEIFREVTTGPRALSIVQSLLAAETKGIEQGDGKESEERIYSSKIRSCDLLGCDLSQEEMQNRINFVVMRKLCSRFQAEELLKMHNWNLESIFPTAKRDPCCSSVSSSSSSDDEGPTDANKVWMQSIESPSQGSSNHDFCSKAVVVAESEGKTKLTQDIKPSDIAEAESKCTAVVLDALHDEGKRARNRARMENTELPRKRKLYQIATQSSSGSVLPSCSMSLSPLQTSSRQHSSTENDSSNWPAKLINFFGAKGNCEGDDEDIQLESSGVVRSDENLPSTSQFNKLLKFFEITGVQKEDHALSILRMCDWKLDLAVQTYFAM